MAEKISNKKIAKNTLISVGAQLISLITSLLVNLAVPKFIDEYQYAYWQTYLLYAGYVGILHFGILDGIVLRFSKYDYEELEKDKIRFIFYILIGMLFIFTTIGLIIGLFNRNVIAKMQICCIAVSIISKNLLSFASYSFQITNRIINYARLVIIQRLFYCSFSMFLIFFGTTNFVYFCIIDLATDFFGFMYSIKFNRKIYYPKPIKILNGWQEFKLVISSGIVLMIANFSNNFIVGSTKIVIQNFWSELVFGQVSFGFSVTNIFLNFVMAISIVLFPSLMRVEKSRLPHIYKSIRTLITPLLLLIMLFYFPACKILHLWLPKYQDSLVYAGILLPIIIYSTKVSLLTNNYLKVYRKERQMLVLNLSCILVELVGLFLIARHTRNLVIILIWTVLIIITRSILAEFLVSKMIYFSFAKDNMVEIMITVLFIICTMNLKLVLGFLIYGIGVFLYLLIYKKEIIKCLQSIKN